MASPRRLGSEKSEVREAIVEAAARVLQEKGFVGLTAKTIAEKAGLKPQLIHYYFQTMDDLIVALVRRGGNYGLGVIARALTSEDPLRGLWEQESDVRGANLAAELMAVGTHRPMIRAEVVRYAEQGRSIQAEAIARRLEVLGIKPAVPPVTIAFVMAAVGRLLAREKAAGMTLGHRETEDVIDHWLRGLTSSGRAGMRQTRQRDVHTTRSSQHQGKSNSVGRSARAAKRKV
jgi:AcrR family transcriptional regulator